MQTDSCITMIGSYDINEDCITCVHKDDTNLYILADGLGGHQKGEVASRTVVDAMTEYFLNHHCVPDEATVCSLFEKAQDELFRMNQNDSGGGMYTTAVILLINQNDYIIGHVGDSRCYCFQGGKSMQRTIDHSVPQMLALAGDIKEKQIRFHQDRNRLLRVMGTKWEKALYEIDFTGKVRENAAFLLCSDGFWELVDEAHMNKYLKKSMNAEEWLQKMQSEVEKNGSGKRMDNYSAIAIMNMRE